jgi:Skp family chaperone for outer membrane proteins
MLSPISTRANLLASLLLGLLAAPISAQDKNFPIAVVNLDKVFNGYKKHAARLQPIREGAKELDESVQIRQVEMETAANQLRKAMPGSPEQLRLQQQLIKLQNDLRIYLETERQKLQKSEVSALIATQKDVDEQIKITSKERGFKLVLRQYPPPEVNQPLQEVVKNLNRDVVYYEDALDITDEVLEALNETKPNGT